MQLLLSLGTCVGFAGLSVGAIWCVDSSAGGPVFLGCHLLLCGSRRGECRFVARRRAGCYRVAGLVVLVGVLGWFPSGVLSVFVSGVPLVVPLWFMALCVGGERVLSRVGVFAW